MLMFRKWTFGDEEAKAIIAVHKTQKEGINVEVPIPQTLYFLLKL